MTISTESLYYGMNEIDTQHIKLIDSLSNRLEAFIEFASREMSKRTDKKIIENTCDQCEERQFYFANERYCHFCQGPNVQSLVSEDEWD